MVGFGHHHQAPRIRVDRRLSFGGQGGHHGVRGIGSADLKRYTRGAPGRLFFHVVDRLLDRLVLRGGRDGHDRLCFIFGRQPHLGERGEQRLQHGEHVDRFGSRECVGLERKHVIPFARLVHLLDRALNAELLLGKRDRHQAAVRRSTVIRVWGTIASSAHQHRVRVGRLEAIDLRDRLLGLQQLEHAGNCFQDRRANPTR